MINKDSTVADTHFVKVNVSDGLLSSTAIIQVIVNDTAYVETGNPNRIVKNIRDHDLTFFPNPATHKINIRLHVQDYQFISLVNVKGNVVHHEKLTGNSVELDVSGFPKGIYILKLYNRHEAIEKILIIQSTGL